MQVHKPRDSLLLLFDPLNTPETPPRNTNSPDSASSDKENDIPSQQPGELTVFFNRIYKDEHIRQIKSPKGKLIDFGEASFASCGDENKQDEDSVTEECEDTPVSPSLQRIPLADLGVERIAPSTSTIPEEPQIAPPTLSWSESSATLSPFVVTSTSHSGSTLADVIKEINFSALTLADKQEMRDHPQELSCPNITVCPPDVEPSPSIPQAQGASSSSPGVSYLSPITSTNCPGATLRTRERNNTSSNDPRRTSVDLQSSFNLQMQSTEMSFDLLNDKISFLNSSSSSHSLADVDMDDTFDLAKEQLRMEEIASQYMRTPAINIEEDTFDLVKEQRRMEAVLKKYVSINEESLTSVARDIPRVKEFTPPKPAPSIEHTLESVMKSNSRPPVFSLPPSASKSGGKSQTKHAADSLEASVLPTDQVQTAASTVPLAKKSWKIQRERAPSTSGSETSSSTGLSSLHKSRPTSIPESSINSDPPSHVLPAAKGPTRRLSNSTSTIRPPVRSMQRPLPTYAPTAPPAAPVKPIGTLRVLTAGTGLSTSKRSVPSSVPARPSVGAKSSVPPATSRLYRPVLPSTVRRESVSAGSNQPKPMLRQPTTTPSITAASTSGGKSGLPRPASRLPAPTKTSSGVARRL